MKRTMAAAAIAAWLAGGLVACSGSNDDAPALNGAARFRVRTNADATPPAIPFDTTTPVFRAQALASWPHDSSAYTQGLLLDGPRVLESTGIAGESEVREVELRTGRVIRRTPLASGAFGEGTTVIGRRLYQLTWQGGRGYVYDAGTLEMLDSVTYDGEGWGLASNGSHLFLSDGTDRIRVIDPKTFAVERTITVREAGQSVWMLNELEWANGELLANVYQTDLVARIDPASGQVVGWIDLGGLLSPVERAAVIQRGGVANGIAFDAARPRLLVTGKRWPRLFEIPLPASMRAASPDSRAGAVRRDHPEPR